MARADDTGHLKTAVVGWVGEMFGAFIHPTSAVEGWAWFCQRNIPAGSYAPSEYSWDDAA